MIICTSIVRLLLYLLPPCSVSPLDQEISKSHESVFREPGDNSMAMLTIGLKVGVTDNNNNNNSNVRISNWFITFYLVELLVVKFRRIRNSTLILL